MKDAHSPRETDSWSHMSNEELGQMFRPLPHRETDPFEVQRVVGTRIGGLLLFLFLMWLLSLLR
ncbi:MAG: hypothetical protein OHK0029_12060 [Armatimonadaceae bacterium]